MNNLNINLSEVLDVEPITIENKVVVIENAIDDDAEYARVNIRALITKGNLAMDNLLHVAKESEHPRAYEVAANMLKNLADMNKDLMEIQKRKKDLLPHETKSNSMNIDKDVFVGSTTELVKFLKNNKA